MKRDPDSAQKIYEVLAVRHLNLLKCPLLAKHIWSLLVLAKINALLACSQVLAKTIRYPYWKKYRFVSSETKRKVRNLLTDLARARWPWALRCSADRELKHRRFWATDVNRKFMFLPEAWFQAQPLSLKAFILAFTTYHFQRKARNTRRRGERSKSGWRPWLKNVCA